MSRQSKKVVAAVDELTQEEREVGGREVERGQGHRGGGDHHGVGDHHGGGDHHDGYGGSQDGVLKKMKM